MITDIKMWNKLPWWIDKVLTLSRLQKKQIAVIP